jgi:hypothetical protein
MDIRCIVTGQNESGKSVIMRNTANRQVAKRLTNWFFLKIFPEREK